MRVEITDSCADALRVAPQDVQRTFGAPPPPASSRASSAPRFLCSPAGFCAEGGFCAKPLMTHDEMTPTVESLRAAGVLGPLHERFARALGRIAAEERPEVLLAAALVSRQVSGGHVCLDLRRLIERRELASEESGPVEIGAWPSFEAWMEALRASALVGGEEEPRPLVLDAHGRLYLRRYWEHQSRLAAALRARAVEIDPSVDGALLARGLARLFPASCDSPDPDWQRLAALLSVQRRLCVISGGPGTGKTFTVVKIIALLAEQALARGKRAPRIALVAPTGKAAARLSESIRRAKAALACDDDVKRAIPEQASTIHRCLGPVGFSATSFRYNEENPLVTDAVIVDEASMIDLALMSRLIAAIPAGARLILLGDKDQLASVEAGAVLGDICNTGFAHRYSRALIRQVEALTGDHLPRDPSAPARTGIWDCIVQLRRSYRYGENSSIGAVARAINAGDAEAALDVLDSGDHSSVRRVEPSPDGSLVGELRRAVRDGFTEYLRAGSEDAALRMFDRFRVLCAHRRGWHAVEPVNRQIEQALTDWGLLRAEGQNYLGRPIMVTRNDYSLGLFNGDVGLIVRDPHDAKARRAYFFSPDGSPRWLSPARLPPHETVFAMSIHKSQGSEFDSVAVLLPDQASPIVSRELLYTAVTRARQSVTVHATREVIRQAIARRIERASGLRDLLWGRPD